MKTRARIKHPVNNYPRKHFPASNIYQIPDPFKLDLFDNFSNSKAFFNIKLDQLMSKKRQNLSYLLTTFPIISRRPKFSIESLSSLF